MTIFDSFFQDSKNNFKRNTFPSDWVTPHPAEKYDLVVVGGGPGGMTAATVARSFDARVALVEKEHLGGECLNYGCIPSKAMFYSSRLAQKIRHAYEYGIEIPKNWKVNFSAVMRRVHEVQTTLSPHDSANHFKSLGIDVFLGAGRFTGPNQLEVNNQTLKFKKAIIATGTQPVYLNINDLEASDYLTNQTIFSLTSLPARLAVIGAGPISCEFAQAFLHFGSQVTLITHGPKLLPRDDTLATQRLKEVFEKEGMKILTNTNLLRAEKRGKEKILYLDTQKEPLVVDEILLGVGRKPAVKGLSLEKAGVTYDLKKGISTNEYLQTSNTDIYAGGDVASPYKFTHMSMELCKIAVANALNSHQSKRSALIVPWCTFTTPEIAHIGLNEELAKEQGIATDSIVIEMKNNDRAVVDGETVGFAKLLIKENQDQIIGATIMAERAGDMISELSAALQGEKSLSAIAQAIHPFPTQPQILRAAAEALMKKQKTPLPV